MNSPTMQPVPSFARRWLLGWRREWLIWALAWCVARGLVLVSFADVFGYGEEFEKACAAKAMLDGLAVPHHQLAYHYYEGGGFVVSHLDALAFFLFGESLLAIKLVALAFGAAILWAGWRFCERLGGRNAARVFALLFVFAPASVQKLSLLTLGIHFHALLFVGLVLDATARLIAERSFERRHWLQLGLAAGFGLYFSYQLVLTLSVAAAALAIGLRGELFGKPAWFAALGFAIGISPLIWMASLVGGEVLDIHGAEVVGAGGKAKLELLGAFFASIFADRSALDSTALFVLCAGPLLGFFALRPSASSGLRIGAWLVLAHILAFLVAYLASGFTVGRVYHYFMLNRLTPLWWLAILFMAIGAAAAWNSRQRLQRGIAACCVAALVSFGALDTARLARDALSSQPSEGRLGLLADNLGILARTTGYEYIVYLTKLSPHMSGDSAEKLRVFLQFRPPRPSEDGASLAMLPQGIAHALYGDGERKLDEIRSELAAAGVEDPRGFYLGMGSLLRAQLGGDVVSRVHAVESHPQPLRDALIEAIGSYGLDARSTEDWVAEKVRQGIAANLPPAYFVGVGRHMHYARGVVNSTRYFEMTDGPWMLNRARAERFARSWPDPIAASLLMGYRAALHDRWLEPAPGWLR